MSSGSNGGPQNTKSGASLMKCTDVQVLTAWKRSWEAMGEKEMSSVFQTEIQLDFLITY